MRKFEEIMLDVRAWLPGEDILGDDLPYEYDRLRILAAPATAADSPNPALVTVMDWPLDELLASGGTLIDEGSGKRCAEISGPDLDTLNPAIAEANELTLWRSAGETYSVQFHPLLPEEEGCPALAGP